MPTHRPPPSPLADFLDRLMDEVVLPRADDMAESLTDWFARMIANAEAQQQGKSVKNTAPPRARSKRSGGKAPPQDHPRVEKRSGPVRLTAYQVLGVDPKAPQEVLAAAYKALAGMYHPDRPEHRKHAGKMTLVNEAWSVVKNPDRRRKYDKEIGL